MYVDALGLVSLNQAFGAGPTVSTNSVDLDPQNNMAPKRQIGEGEPMGFAFAVTVAATGTTVILEVISATDGALTASVRVHGRLDGVVADFPAGSLHFIAINQTTAERIQRFIGIRSTVAAGTLSGTSWLTSHALFSILARPYRKNYAV
jgi:hypothetical protein